MPAGCRVIVYPPTQTGGRRLRVDGEILGVAYGMRDFIKFLRRAGIDPHKVSVTDPDLVEWRGAGPTVWRCGHGGPAKPASGRGRKGFPTPAPSGMVDVTLDGPLEQVSRVRAWIESRAASGSSMLMELPGGKVRCRLRLLPPPED